MPRNFAFVSGLILSQQGALFPWLPVFFATGIGAFFGLRFEPDGLIYGVAGVGVSATFLALRYDLVTRVIGVGVLALCVGFLLAAWRTHNVAEPVLGFRYYGPVEGRIVHIDKSASDAIRLTLDHVVLFDMSPQRTPSRVRVSLHGDQSHFTPHPGETIVMAAHLSPPSGPVEPGGFDFQRHAWFQKLGAVGYTRSPVLTLQPSHRGVRVFRLRYWIAEKIREGLPDNRGGFVVAIVTGDRSGISQASLDSLRASNLAHLLAISGLHMGMLTGFVFAIVRGGLALVPRISLRVSSKKISALSALVAASIYLALSGGAIPTERAFVMVAVALVAVLLGRRAISLRAVSVAAMIVLIRSPEALLGPGFQMSFAATAALVGVFTLLRDSEINMGPKWLRPVTAVVVSSAVAGLATAPFGAAHFNQISQYGLLANVLSVPVMGTIVVPGAVLAAVLAPFGGAWIGLEVAAAGLGWILTVSDWVSGLDGAARMVPQPSSGFLPLVAIGGLWMVLWKGRGKWLGGFAFLAAAWLWVGSERPYALVADTGGIVGVMTEEGRALSKDKGSGFIAGVWLENDGDAATQLSAHQRWTGQILHVTGKKSVAALVDCQGAEIVVVNAEPSQDLPCLVISPRYLRQTGSLAIAQNGEIRSSRDVHGNRIWHPWTRD